MSAASNSPAETPAETHPAPPRGALAVIFLTVFIDLLGFGMVLPLLSIYGERLTTEAWRGPVIGLLMCTFSAMQFLFSPLWGKLSDRIGRRPVLLVGLGGSVVCYFLFGLASVWESLLLLFIARIGAGVAGATIPTAQAYIADVTPPEKRTQGMALIGAAFGLGFTFGPLLALASLPWEIVPAGTRVPLSAGPGYLASAVCACAFVLAWFRLPESLHPDAASRRQGRQGGWIQLRQVPSLAWLIGANVIMVLAFAAFESTLSVLLGGEEGSFKLPPQRVALIFAFIGLTTLFAQGVLVRRLSKRLSEGTLAISGAIIQMTGLLLLTQAGMSASQGLLFFSLALVVTGFAFMTSSLNSLISRRSDPDQQGSVLGLNQSFGALSRIVGPLVSLNLFYLNHGAQPLLPLWLSAGLLMVCLLLVIVGVRGGKDWQTAVKT